MSKISELADSLREDYDEDLVCEVLDEMVHDAKGEEAAAINNDGLESQLEYLFKGGTTEESIREALDDLTCGDEE